MRTEVLTYEADGLSMQSELFVNGDAGPRPGILVFPEAFGLGDHARSRARRLAEQGYAALACDLHGGGQVIDDLPTVMGLLEPLRSDPPRIRARAGGGLAALTARPEVDSRRIAATAFCVGGTTARERAPDGADIAAAAGFHSGLATVAPQDAANIKGKILVCIGADDPGIPPEQRAAFEQEMRNGKVDWQMHLYGGVVHSFTNPEADRKGMPDYLRYDARADARSWAAMNGLFDELF